MEKYRHFGVMLDCSRNAVINVATTKKFIDYIAVAGYNTLELYMEDVYKIESEHYFGYMRGGYSKTELKAIDEYAAKKGIKLIPAIQTLAHFTNLVKLEKYRDIVDVNDILLIDDEKTYSLIENMFKTLAECFTSREVNIGMDEAHMVGLGKYLDIHGFTNRYELLIRHLKRVSAIAEKYGFTAHMWSDMFFRLANNGEYYGANVKLDEKTVSYLPENIDPIYWDYYHTNETDYDNMFSVHKKFNKNVWFAGGAWCWNGFAPYNGYSLKSMKAAMKSVRKNEIKDVFITMWGDNGKECSFFSLLPSLFAIRRYADGCFDDEKIKTEFKDAYGLSFDDFMMLDLPNSTPIKSDELENPCKVMLYSDSFIGFYDNLIERHGNPDYLKLSENLKFAAERAGDLSYIFDCLSALCSALDIKYDLGLRIRTAYNNKDLAALGKIAEEMDILTDRITNFWKAFKKLWFIENKPFGFEVQEARLGGVILRVKSCKERLIDYINGEIETIEELDETLLPYNSINAISNNCYCRMISPSEL